MGKQNRQRRAEKRRREASRATARGRRYGIGYEIDALVECAAIVFAEGDHEGFRKGVATLVAGPPVPGGQALVDRALAFALVRAKETARARGWAPGEVRRVVQRQLSARHARLVGAELGSWAAAEGVGRAEAVASAIEVLSWLMRLPPLPTAPARPRAASTDARHLERIRALLAKAESTTFAEEADALTAKAQELMSRYAIDQAMLGRAEAERAPSVRRVWIDDPYAGPKSLLLCEIAGANRCRSVWGKLFGFATVFGFEPDLDAVELLFTSLLVQATLGLKANGSRAYRQSFLIAFATRIGGRLRGAAQATVAEATREHGSALAPVLVADTAAVDDACHRAFPRMTQRSFSVSSYAGWAAGVTAAELANLSTREEIDVLQKLVV